MSDKGQVRCSFCGKKESMVKKLIAGPGVCICDECVELCWDLLYDDLEDEAASAPESIDEKSVNLLKPIEIKRKLDEYVVGQDSAKKALAVAVYNHYKRIKDNEAAFEETRNSKKQKIAQTDGSSPFAETELSKSNVLLIGPTGVGKTYLAPDSCKNTERAFCDC